MVDTLGVHGSEITPDEFVVSIKTRAMPARRGRALVIPDASGIGRAWRAPGRSLHGRSRPPRRGA